MCLTVPVLQSQAVRCAAGFSKGERVLRSASMASSQQGARNMRQKSVDDQPLTDSEVRMTTGLLYRAVCHGQAQAQAVIQTYRASVIPKRFQVGAVSLMNDVQMFTGLANCAKEIHATQSAQLQTVSGESMTDAAKRRLDPESPHSLTESVWEELAASNAESPPMHYKISSGYPVPMPGYGDFPPSNEVSYVNHKIKIPEEGMTFEQWGHTICIMDKVKALELNYVGLIKYAKHDSEIERYLGWIVNTYGSKGTGQIRGKITRAVDLALFLEASGWRAASPSQSSQVAFTRTLKG